MNKLKLEVTYREVGKLELAAVSVQDLPRGVGSHEIDGGHATAGPSSGRLLLTLMVVMVLLYGGRGGVAVAGGCGR